MKIKKDLLLLCFFILLFIVIRSINFVDFLNFSSDQAGCSIRALNLLETKKLSLIGVEMSFKFNGRYLFHGPLGCGISYLPFLILGGFDPLRSSYVVMLFGSLAIIPFYFGTKWLISKKAALFMLVIYTLFPLYIDSTRFLWDPNFQFIMLSLLILLMGLYKKKKKGILFFVVSLSAGILLQFHYGIAAGILALIIYYFFITKEGWKKFSIFILGIALGFFPLIIFELRHNFYNLRTLWLFIQHYDVVFLNKGHFPTPAHYFLIPTFFLFLAVSSLIKKWLNNYRLLLIFLVMFVWSSILYVPKPQYPYSEGGKLSWKYSDEKKVHQIISSQNLTDFNVTALFYDNKAAVQKYFLKRDKISGDFEDYYKNKYLFVINDNNNFQKYLAYEVKTFSPAKILKSWKINQKYSLYLLKRER